MSTIVLSPLLAITVYASSPTRARLRISPLIRPQIPFIPYYNGLWLWRKAISHGREYRTPEKYAGKNVLVVGAKASGYDITREIAESFSKAVGSNQGKVRSICLLRLRS